MSDANSALRTTLGARTRQLPAKSLLNSSANDLTADRGFGLTPGPRSESSANGWPRSQGGGH
jgi:hypothetical protein